MYSSGFCNDEMRLIFCLVIHPFILEFCLHMCRQNSIAEYDGYAQVAGLDPDSMDTLNKQQLFNEETNIPMFVEAILVFNRRFLIG